MLFINDMIYYTFLGIMGIKAAHYDPTDDFFSPKYDKDVTTLMTMYGNIMIRNDVEQLGSDKAANDAAWNQGLQDRARASGSDEFDWSRFKPVKISAKPMPEVENEGLSQAS